MMTNKVIQLNLLLILLPYFTEGQCPNIIKRSEWGAQKPKSVKPLPESPAPFVVVHHSDGQGCETVSNCKTRIQGIQNYHMVNKGWEDIGYQFLIGGDGNVYEGRGWGLHGAHSPAYNRRSVGICMLGNFQHKRPSNVQLETLKALVQCAASRGHIIENYHLIGHRQGSKTDCPGDELFNEISTWPHFDPNPSPLKI